MGLDSDYYGEAVGAFVESQSPRDMADEEEILNWARSALAWYKVPQHIFWLGEGGVPSQLPLTGSGKVKRFELTKMGNRLLRCQGNKAKL